MGRGVHVCLHLRVVSFIREFSLAFYMGVGVMVLGRCAD